MHSIAVCRVCFLLSGAGSPIFSLQSAVSLCGRVHGGSVALDDEKVTGGCLAGVDEGRLAEALDAAALQIFLVRPLINLLDGVFLRIKLNVGCGCGYATRDVFLD